MIIEGSLGCTSTWQVNYSVMVLALLVATIVTIQIYFSPGSMCLITKKCQNKQINLQLVKIYLMLHSMNFRVDG